METILPYSQDIVLSWMQPKTVLSLEQKNHTGQALSSQSAGHEFLLSHLQLLYYVCRVQYQ